MLLVLLATFGRCYLCYYKVEDVTCYYKRGICYLCYYKMDVTCVTIKRQVLRVIIIEFRFTKIKNRHESKSVGED